MKVTPTWVRRSSKTKSSPGSKWSTARRTTLPNKCSSSSGKSIDGSRAIAANHGGGKTTENSGLTSSAGPGVGGRSTAPGLPVAFNGRGTRQPLNVGEVKVGVDGQVEKVALKEGQEVDAGDLLAQIDPRPFEVQQAQAEATRAKDEAQLRNAKADVARYLALIDTGGVAAQTLEASK